MFAIVSPFSMAWVHNAYATEALSPNSHWGTCLAISPYLLFVLPAPSAIPGHCGLILKYTIVLPLIEGNANTINVTCSTIWLNCIHMDTSGFLKHFPVLTLPHRRYSIVDE